MIFICTYFSTTDKESARSKQEFVLLKKNRDIYMFFMVFEFFGHFKSTRGYIIVKLTKTWFCGFLLLYSVKWKYLHKSGHPN